MIITIDPNHIDKSKFIIEWIQEYIEQEYGININQKQIKIVDIKGSIEVHIGKSAKRITMKKPKGMMQ
jgi:hypothetical protein